VKHQTPLTTDEHDAGRRVDEAAAAAAAAAGGCGVSQLHRLTVVNVTVHCEHSPTRSVHTHTPVITIIIIIIIIIVPVKPVFTSLVLS